MILLVANNVLNLSTMLLSGVPFGPLLPLVLQAGIAVFLAPPTRFIVKFLLFRLWEVLPARPDDQFSVSLDDKLNVLVHGQNGETNEIIAQTAAPPIIFLLSPEESDPPECCSCFPRLSRRTLFLNKACTRFDKQENE